MCGNPCVCKVEGREAASVNRNRGKALTDSLEAFYEDLGCKSKNIPQSLAFKVFLTASEINMNAAAATPPANLAQIEVFPPNLPTIISSHCSHTH